MRRRNQYATGKWMVATSVPIQPSAVRYWNSFRDMGGWQWPSPTASLAAPTKKESPPKVNGVRFASFGMVAIDLRGSAYIDAAWEAETRRERGPRAGRGLFQC